MKRRTEAIAFGVVCAVALAALAGFVVFDYSGRWGSTSVSIMLNAVASWVAAVGLVWATRAEKGRVRLPWKLLSAAFFVFAAAETVQVYFRVITAVPKWMYLLSFAEVIPLVILVAAFSIRSASLPAPFFNVKNVVLTTAVLAAVGVLYLPSLFKVLSSPRVPAVAVVLTFIPVIHLAALVISIHIATTFSGGVVGRSWVAFAFGVFFLASGQFLSIYAACRPDWRLGVLSISRLTSLAGYLTITWGALYHRRVIRQDAE